MKYFIIIVFLSAGQAALSQNERVVHWLTFEQLDDSLKIEQKKVFIDFYADWCAPCLKIQKEVFTAPEIINKLNKDFYAVKMNVETTDTISFGNEIFVNERKNRRNPIHQIPLLMALQKNKPFSLPALVFMDDNFKATARYFQYLNKEQLLKILSQ